LVRVGDDVAYAQGLGPSDECNVPCTGGVNHCGGASSIALHQVTFDPVLATVGRYSLTAGVGGWGGWVKSWALYKPSTG